MKHNYVIKIAQEIITLKAESLNNLDLISKSPGNFHVLRNNRAFHVELLQADFSNKKLKINVNGNQYDLAIQDPYDQLINQMGLSSAKVQQMKLIKAPMPGMILEIMVKEGQEVSAGTPLVILEAMKMENILKSAGEGTIKSIEVQKETAVDKGQIIIELL